MTARRIIGGIVATAVVLLVTMDDGAPAVPECGADAVLVVDETGTECERIDDPIER